MTKDHQKTGGRKQGVTNKITQEIREILEENVDFSIVVTKLYELSQGVHVAKEMKEATIVYQEKPDPLAAKILLEYMYGKPLQKIDQKNEGGLHIKITRDGS